MSTPLFKADGNTGYQLTSNRMVTNILVITTIGLILITGAVTLQAENQVAAWALGIAASISFGTIFLSRRGMTLPGRVLLPTILLLVAAFIAYSSYGLYHVSVVGFPVIVILAGLLLGVRGSFAFAFLGSLAAAWLGYTDINRLNPNYVNPITGYDDILVSTVLLFTTASVLRLIIQRLSNSLLEAEANANLQAVANIELQELQKNLEQRVEQRTEELQIKVEQLQTIAQVSRSITGIQNLDELLSSVTELISTDFDIYHTGIFLVDESGENAVLRAANSEGGQKMLARGHRLKVGAQGIVGYVTARGQARVALDVGKDAVYFDNPDLPETRSEIALPLTVAGNIFGALDLQSTQPDAFGDDDIQTLSVLASQVAIAIQNARSFEQSRQAIEETEKAYHQMTGQAWKQHAASIEVLGYEYDGSGVKPKTETSSDGSSLDIPLILRGQSIGKLKLSALEPDRDWTEDERVKAQAVAERTALALESARLLEDAQRRAARERTISDISTSISKSSDLDVILRTAVQTLGRSIGGAEVVLELDPDLAESGQID